jgi:hypothetical protein
MTTGGKEMKNTRSASTLLRRAAAALALAGAVIVPPALATLTDFGAATAVAQPASDDKHGGPDYQAITGSRVGAPSEYDVSYYGGSHKHLSVEQQLYGSGVVVIPQVDTTVHQSR